MGSNLLINGVYWGCNQLTNLATLLPMPIFSASPGRAANRQPAARDRGVEVRDPEHEVHQVRGKLDDKFGEVVWNHPVTLDRFCCRRLQPLRWKDRVMPRPNQKRRVTDPLSFRGVSHLLWIPNYHERPCRSRSFPTVLCFHSCENKTTIDSEKSSTLIGPEKRNGKSPCANLEAEIHHLGCTRQHGCSKNIPGPQNYTKTRAKLRKAWTFWLCCFGVNRNWQPSWETSFISFVERFPIVN